MSKPKKKLHLSNDKRVLGVIGGFADYYGFDATIARVVYVIIMIFTQILPLTLLYFLLWFIMRNPSNVNGEFVDAEFEEK